MEDEEQETIEREELTEGDDLDDDEFEEAKLEDDALKDDQDEEVDNAEDDEIEDDENEDLNETTEMDIEHPRGETEQPNSDNYDFGGRGNGSFDSDVSEVGWDTLRRHSIRRQQQMEPLAYLPAEQIATAAAAVFEPHCRSIRRGCWTARPRPSRLTPSKASFQRPADIASPAETPQIPGDALSDCADPQQQWHYRSVACTPKRGLVPGFDYQEDFGEKVCIQYSLSCFLDQLRRHKYGEEIARTYHMGFTPEEVREAWRAEKDAALEAFYNPSDSESEAEEERKGDEVASSSNAKGQRLEEDKQSSNPTLGELDGQAHDRKAEHLEQLLASTADHLAPRPPLRPADPNPEEATVPLSSTSELPGHCVAPLTACSTCSLCENV